MIKQNKCLKVDLMSETCKTLKKRGISLKKKHVKKPLNLTNKYYS